MANLHARVVLLSALLGPALLPACTKPNPTYCTKSEECESNFCQPDHYCQPMSGGAPRGGSGGGRAGSGGAPGEDGSAPSDFDAIIAPGDTGETGGAPGTGGQPASPDAPAADVPDTRPICDDNAQCTSPGMKVCVNHVCVACEKKTEVSDCPREGRPFCDSANMCVPCTAILTENPGICVMPTPFCIPDLGTCQQCRDFNDCKGDATKPLCSSKKACVDCTSGGGNAACMARDAGNPICRTDGACVQCGVSTDCVDAAKPICIANHCEVCTTDKQCAERGEGPGICLTDPDGKAGRCATEAETIYVGGNPCSASNKGVKGSPFCQPADAAKALSTARRVILFLGSDSFFGFTIDKAGGPVYIVANNGAAITPGPTAGIVVGNNAVDVRIRGLAVRGSDDTGIIAKGAATVRLDRCVLKNNNKGGFIAQDGAGFDIANTVFDTNSVGSVGAASFGGAYLGKPNNRPKRFRFNTVIGNLAPGVACQDATQDLTGSILNGNVPDSINCKVSPTSSVGEPPMLDATYHLTSASPCLNRVDPAADAPPDDLDGDPRPQETKLDCGADERK